MTMKMSRRETMQLSATALAGMSFAAVKSLEAAAQTPPAQSTPAQPGVLFLGYSRLVRDDPVIGVRQQAFYRIIDATHVEGPRHRAVR